MHSASTVGQMAAIAGRSTPSIVFRQNLAMTMSAPVLPADTAAVGAPVLHRLEREPHARPVAAFAERLARLRVHGDRHIGVDDLGLRGERGMGRKLGLDAGGVADQRGIASRDGGSAQSRPPE